MKPIIVTLLVVFCLGLIGFYQFYESSPYIYLPAETNTRNHHNADDTYAQSPKPKLQLPLDLSQRIATDIAQYTNESRSSIADFHSCRGKLKGPLLIYIVNGSVYVPSDQYERYLQKGKARSTAMLLQSAVTFHHFPNTVLLMVAASTGYSCYLKEKSLSVPTFCIAKRNADRHSGSKASKCILIPNMFFGSLYEWKNTSDSIRLKSRIEPKKKQLFWLGGIDGRTGWKRGKFLLLANDSKLITAHAFTTKADETQWNETYTQWKVAANMSDSQISAIKALPKVKSVKKDGEFAKFFGKYKGNIALPGKTCGSYSRHLQRMLALDSVPFLWDNEWYEWYYDGLRHGFNIIKVNETNLYSETERVLLRMSDEEIDAIKHNKEQFFLTHLTAEAVAAYIYNLFVTYQTIQPQIIDWNVVKNNAKLLPDPIIQ